MRRGTLIDLGEKGYLSYSRPLEKINCWAPLGRKRGERKRETGSTRETEIKKKKPAIWIVEGTFVCGGGAEPLAGREKKGGRDLKKVGKKPTDYRSREEKKNDTTDHDPLSWQSV